MEIRQIKIVKTPNVSETLKEIPVGEQVAASRSTLSVSAVRAAATRLKYDGYAFVIKENTTGNNFYVTRVQ